MSVSLKLESIFSIIAALGTMQYEFENGVVAKVAKTLVITAMNLLVCYLIVEVDYASLFLSSKLIISSIKFEVFRETDFANDGLAKLERQTRSG